MSGRNCGGAHFSVRLRLAMIFAPRSIDMSPPSRTRKWSKPLIEKLDIDLTSIAAFQKKSGDGVGSHGVVS